MRFTAATTRLIPSISIEPEKPCSRVRPWMVRPATPACSNSRANSGAVIWEESQPRRILTVTGMETASTTARTSSIALDIWHSMAEPPPPLVTLLTGHPMLMSILAKPSPSFSTKNLAASANSGGRAP